MPNRQPNACLICGAPLVYFTEERTLTCTSCGKPFSANAACEHGHFICDQCHGSAGRVAVRLHCLEQSSSDPVEIALSLMALPAIHMHGPEHHTLVGAALLTAYRNAGGEIVLEQMLRALEQRSQKVPGGTCGFWGCCGAAVSAGIFLSLVTGSTPLSGESFGLCNRLTAACLQAIGEAGGPRCCKRNSFLVLTTAVPFVKEHLGVSMTLPEQVVCTYPGQNGECLGRRCPFHPAADRPWQPERL